MGTVIKAGKGCFILDNTLHGIEAGDGICYMAESTLAGTNVNKVDGGAIYPDKPDVPRPGTKIYRNYDHRFHKALENSEPDRTIPVDMLYSARAGKIEVTAGDRSGCRAAAAAHGNWQPARDAARMKVTLEAHLAKSGGTLFNVASVTPADDTDPLPFVPVSVVNALRREVLEKLAARRLQAFEQKKKEELAAALRDDSFPYPSRELGGDANVTNSLARKFWTMHGVETIAFPFDLRDSLEGQVVMTTPYCLRRETGHCLKDKENKTAGELYLHSGGFRYRLGFDCRACLMTLTKCRGK
ncbi:MAG: DUF3656 domain-containing protein [Rikenellaceae bacterium]|nr:DUF3656 domain-containing protein [Rikenellaceae bacterium]